MIKWQKRCWNLEHSERHQWILSSPNNNTCMFIINNIRTSGFTYWLLCNNLASPILLPRKPMANFHTNGIWKAKITAMPKNVSVLWTCKIQDGWTLCWLCLCHVTAIDMAKQYHKLKFPWIDPMDIFRYEKKK